MGVVSSTEARKTCPPFSPLSLSGDECDALLRRDASRCKRPETVSSLFIDGLTLVMREPGQVPQRHRPHAALPSILSYACCAVCWDAPCCCHVLLNPSVRPLPTPSISVPASRSPALFQAYYSRPIIPGLLFQASPVLPDSTSGLWSKPGRQQHAVIQPRPQLHRRDVLPHTHTERRPASCHSALSPDAQPRAQRWPSFCCS
jgi:hypothetical protein